MKKFVIFANCQGGPLAQTLTENKEFSSIYEWLPLPPVQNLKLQDITDVLEKVKDADLLLYQPVSKSLNRPIELTSTFLTEHVKASTKTISFSSMYFDGYFPHLQTLNNYVSVLNLVHDYVIAYCCSIGLSVENTLKIINSEDLYPEEVSIRLAENVLVQPELDFWFVCDKQLQTEENPCEKKRHNYTPEEKVSILRRHLVEHVAVSDLCDEYQLQPRIFYVWQKQFFENGAAAFIRDSRPQKHVEEVKIQQLEAKLTRKHEVLSELMEEHIKLKKELGEL